MWQYYTILCLLAGKSFSVFTERNRIGGDMALVLFDVLHLQGRSVMREPWRDRRKRLEDLLQGHRIPRVAVLPVSDDAPTLYETWVGMGGEGIVLKDPASLYRPGARSPAWLKLKPKLTLDVTVTGRSDQRIASGDWGEAVKQERSILSRYFIPSITDLPTWARSPSPSPAESQEGRRG
jgi:ATP-dependent DNA ligase